jgi:hypothetical protein
MQLQVQVNNLNDVLQYKPGSFLPGFFMVTDPANAYVLFLQHAITVGNYLSLRSV